MVLRILSLEGVIITFIYITSLEAIFKATDRGIINEY